MDELETSAGQVADEPSNEGILKALRDSEQRFRALVTAGAQTIYRMSPDWGLMYELDGGGFETTAEPIANWAEKYILEDDRPRVFAAIREAIRSRSLFELEHRVRLGDGSIGWLLSRAVPLFGADGEIVEWFGAGSDVTERKRSEQALQDSETKYRALFQTMGQGYCELELIRDAEGRPVDQLYLELNPAFERMFGIPVADARGRRASEVMPDLEPSWHERFDRIAKTGVPERIVHEVRSLGRSFEVFAYPRGGDRLTVLYEDVTDRRLAEQSLRESEERQAFLLKLTDALRPLSDAEDIRLTAATVLGRHLGASRVAYAEDDGDGESFTVFQDYVDGAPDLSGRFRYADFGKNIPAQLHAGRNRVQSDIANDKHLTDAQRRRFADAGIGASMNVPLVKSGRLVAFLGVNYPTAHNFQPQEIRLVEEVAERTWSALERARAEGAVRESEERLEAIFQALPIGVGLLDLNGKILLSNQQMQRYLPTGTLPSRDPERVAKWEAWDEEGRRIAPSDFPGARALRGEHVVPGVEMLYTDDNGESVWTSISAVPVRDGDGQVTAQVAAILDITEQTRAEQALRESEQRFREFGEASSDLLWIRDAETLAFEYISPAFERLYGVPRDQVLDRNNVAAWLELIHPDDRDTAADALRRLREGRPGKIEFRVNRPDGGHCWIQNTDFPMFDHEGEVQRIAGIAQDISERKRAVEMQGTLLAELQHRVRNVLAMVRSVVRRTSSNKDDVEDFVEHLEGRIDAMARTQALLTRSPGAGVAMDTLVRDEMVSQSVVDGKVEVDGPPVQLSPLAAEVLTLAIHELATNSVKYGALGQAEGQVSVTWRCQRGPEERRLQLTWLETGLSDEKAGEPGFGTELITERVPYELKGEGCLTVGGGTLVATIAFPLEAGSSILDTDTARSIGAEL